MKSAQATKRRLPDSLFIWLRYIPSAAICFIFIFALLCAPGQASKGVSGGISICLKTVIPSLFPFIFISSFMVQSGLHIRLGSLFRRSTRLLFRQPSSASGIIIMSLIGGLPVGARMAAQVYANGELTKKQAQRLCLFCINAGPAFVISAVGGSMLGSYKAGTIIYVSVTLAAILCGILTRFTDSDSEEPILPAKNTESVPVFTAMTRAADSSAKSMLSICVWVVVFTCVMALLGRTGLSDMEQTAAAGILEVTSGCVSAAGVLPIPVIAGIIGWGGLSAHCQILSGTVRIGVNLRLFFTARILCGAFSALICKWLLMVFPVNTLVFSLPGGATADLFSASAPISIGLLAMCALLLVGEGVNIKLRDKPQAALRE